MKVAPEALIYVARVVKDDSGSLNEENVAKVSPLSPSKLHVVD